tara:strand:+ start:155 stop:1459 length:1305 start_codon:yes stop_codon:yes gene_type:complete
VSVQSQKAFLTKLHNELLVTGDEYRKLVNVQFHTFVLTRRALRKGIKDRVEKNFAGVSKAEVAAILKGCDAALYKVIRDTAKSINAVETPGLGGVTLQKQTKSRVEATFDASGQNRYAQITRLYTQHLSKATPAVIRSIEGVLNETSNVKSKSLWNLNHKHLEGIIETQVRDAINNALIGEEEITKKHLTAFMKKNKISLEVIRDTRSNTAHVSLGSQRENSKEGGISGARKQKLQKALLKAIKQLDSNIPIAELPGSDSFVEVFEKKVVTKTLDPFRGKKNVKVSKASKTKHSKKKHTIKVTPAVKAAASLRRRKSIKAAAAKKAPAAQPLQLLAMINAKLPATVRKNMNSPMLVNRTGTFADSVKLTDISKTPKGFPSIGYTYDKSPYGVFEMGNGDPRFATPERDPRRIIDQSIREIAAHLAIGRFFTRRV